MSKDYLLKALDILENYSYFCKVKRLKIDFMHVKAWRMIARYYLTMEKSFRKEDRSA